MKNRKTMNTKSFRELYEIERTKPAPPSPALVFLMKVANETKRSVGTVRYWLTGAQEPDRLTKSILAKKFNTTPEILFPPSMKQAKKRRPGRPRNKPKHETT